MTQEYQIIVKRIDKDVPFKDQEYKVTGKKTNGDDEYNYVSFDSTKDIEKVVFNQTVDDLDLVSVINAINK